MPASEDEDQDEVYPIQGAVRAVCTVVHEMLQMKYGRCLDVEDFAKKASKHADCTDPLELVQQLNKLPDLRFKDDLNRELFQLNLHTEIVNDFKHLRAEVSQTSGTARAVAITRSDEIFSGKKIAVAVFREGYVNSQSLVGRVDRLSPGGSSSSGANPSLPLRRFGANEFCKAVVIDPSILKVVRYNNREHSMEEESVPSPLEEYTHLSASAPAWSFEEESSRPPTSGKGGSRGIVAVPLSALLEKAENPNTNAQEAAKAAGAALKHPDLRAQEAVPVISRLSVLRSQNVDALAEADGVGVHGMLVQALKRFGADSLITQQICHAICEAAHGDRAGAALLLKAGAPGVVCGVMDAHPGEPAVLSSAISSLRCLAANGSPQMVKAAGAIQAVQKVLEQYPRDKALERGGNDVLKLLGAAVVRDCTIVHSAQPNTTFKSVAWGWIHWFWHYMGNSPAREVFNDKNSLQDAHATRAVNMSSSVNNGSRSGSVCSRRNDKGCVWKPPWRPQGPRPCRNNGDEESLSDDLHSVTNFPPDPLWHKDAVEPNQVDLEWQDNGTSSSCIRGPWAIDTMPQPKTQSCIAAEPQNPNTSPEVARNGGGQEFVSPVKNFSGHGPAKSSDTPETTVPQSPWSQESSNGTSPSGIKKSTNASQVIGRPISHTEGSDFLVVAGQPEETAPALRALHHLDFDEQHHQHKHQKHSGTSSTFPKPPAATQVAHASGESQQVLPAPDNENEGDSDGEEFGEELYRKARREQFNLLEEAVDNGAKHDNSNSLKEAQRLFDVYGSTPPPRSARSPVREQFRCNEEASVSASSFPDPESPDVNSRHGGSSKASPGLGKSLWTAI